MHTLTFVTYLKHMRIIHGARIQNSEPDPRPCDMYLAETI